MSSRPVTSPPINLQANNGAAIQCCNAQQQQQQQRRQQQQQRQLQLPREKNLTKIIHRLITSARKIIVQCHSIQLCLLLEVILRLELISFITDDCYNQTLNIISYKKNKKPSQTCLYCNEFSYNERNKQGWLVIVNFNEMFSRLQ